MSADKYTEALRLAEATGLPDHVRLACKAAAVAGLDPRETAAHLKSKVAGAARERRKPVHKKRLTIYTERVSSVDDIVPQDYVPGATFKIYGVA